MAWIEDPFGEVLLVKQGRGKKLWSFPGGKVGSGESLLDALRREVKEELGVDIDVATLIDYYDRTEKRNVTFLFRVILKGKKFVLAPGEIEAFGFKSILPTDSTPSLAYFWPRAQRSFEPLSML